MLNTNVFKRDDTYLEHLGSSIWLMDNHKWALYIWDTNQISTNASKLVHVDYHWDAGYDYWELPDKEKELIRANSAELKLLIEQDELIRYDSFIGPALARNLVSEVHFLCFQEDSDKGFYKPVLEKFNCKQTIHNNISDLEPEIAGKPLIFDFDVDVFNRSKYEYKSELWDVVEIDNFLSNCKPLVQAADLITVSMSYSCSGTVEDTESLTKLVVQKFMAWRNDS